MNYRDIKRYRKMLIEVLGGKCQSCGTTENLVVHHVTYDPPSYQLLCARCHRRVHADAILENLEATRNLRFNFFRKGTLKVLKAMANGMTLRKDLFQIAEVGDTTLRKITNELEELNLIQRIDDQTLPARIKKPEFNLTKRGKDFIRNLGLKNNFDSARK